MTIMNMKIIGERIRSLRLALRLTQQELADQLHITRSCLANYERGERQISYELLEIVAKFFLVDLDYLLGNIRSPINESFMTSVINANRYLTKDGKLDVSMLTPVHRAFTAELVNYLRITERLEKRQL